MFHRRRHERVKRRFACEFFAGDQRYRGIVVELSQSGLFLQTDATTRPGTEIEIHLSGAGIVPDMRLRAVVVRRRMVPAPLATAVRRGISLELLEAPAEYGLACGSAPLAAPIRIARASGALDSEGAAEGARPLAEPVQDAGPPVELAPGEGEAPIARRWTPAAPLRAEDDAPPRPAVLVVDDGSLADIVEVLRGLGAETTHLQIGAASPSQPFVRPRRLFVTTARLACSLFLPEPSDQDDGMLALAVAADESQTLAAMMSRLGFQYLVHRPTHPEALRILLRRILYRGAEHRSAQRLPFGSEVRWRTGWRGERSPMVEVSASGCRLHAHRGPRIGARVRIWIPPEATGDRRIALRGRVVRRDSLSAPDPLRRWELAVEFETLSRRMQRRLDALLARCARRPGLLAVPVATGLEAAPPIRVLAAATPLAAAPAAPGEPPEDRRRMPRARLERGIVALDDAGTRARHALVGRDLSARGMRIDPHPELVLHQRLRIALYEPSIGAPVLLDAEVARDDGEAGLGLHFVDLPPETAAHLARIVSALPSVQTLQPRPTRVVVGELLGERPAA